MKLYDDENIVHGGESNDLREFVLTVLLILAIAFASVAGVILAFAIPK